MQLSPLNQPSALRAMTPTPLPIAQLVLGRPVDEVVALLPRLFNLCRAAQETAVRLALGLEVPPDVDLLAEIRREHVFRLGVVLPAKAGLETCAVPATDAEIAKVFFAGGRFPDDVAAFGDFLVADQGVARLLNCLLGAFAPYEACSEVLPELDADNLYDAAAVENSVAARHLHHPVMQYVETQFGRGPLWRTVARAVDLQAVLDSDLPKSRRLNNGLAMVPAARGIYAVQARSEHGRVTSFRRVTPTDHLLAEGGILQCSLASLPVAKHDKAGLLVDILDPCSPVQLKGQADA